MVTSSSLLDELDRTVRRSLLPQRFPMRRDLELAAAAKDAHGAACFFDNFWIDQQVLAIIVVRLQGAGLEGAVAAVGMKQLLRAVIANIPDAPGALTAFADLSRLPALDAALLLLDTISGSFSFATAGHAAVIVQDTTGIRQAGVLYAGGTIWLSAGEVDEPMASGAQLGDLQAFVDPLIARSGGGAACLFTLKSRSRAKNSATFIVPNEQSEIPAFLEKAGRFLSDQSLGEDETAGIEVALDEILTNSVNYGFKDGNRHEILVSISAEPKRLVVEVSDDGVPFDPLGVPQPDLAADIDHREVGGLGMHFVRTLLDSVSYRRSNGWNVLRLEKQLRQRQEREEA